MFTNVGGCEGLSLRCGLLLIDVFLAQAFKDCVGPAKACLGWVDAFEWWFFWLYDVVFFQEIAVLLEPIQVGFQPFVSDVSRLVLVTITLQAFDHQEMQWRPAVGVSPLGWHSSWHVLAELLDIRSDQSARLFELFERLDHLHGLLVIDHTGPEWIKPSQRGDSAPFVLHIIIIVVEASEIAPHQIVHGRTAVLGSGFPFVGKLFFAYQPVIFGKVRLVFVQ